MSIVELFGGAIAVGFGVLGFLFVCSPILQQGPWGWVACISLAALLIQFAAT